MYAAVALVNWWWLEVHPLRSLALTFGFRVILFDYLVQYVLIKRGVIRGKWWSYHGKTSAIDVALRRVNWRIILVFKILVFIATIWVFFYICVHDFLLTIIDTLDELMPYISAMSS